MKEHAESEGHILAYQMETAASSALCEGSLCQQMHQLEKSERLKIDWPPNFFYSAHFFAYNHTAHATNFGDLVDLTVACGGENLKQFVDKAEDKCSLHLKRCSR